MRLGQESRREVPLGIVGQSPRVRQDHEGRQVIAQGPRPYDSHEPRQGNPGIKNPQFIM